MLSSKAILAGLCCACLFAMVAGAGRAEAGDAKAKAEEISYADLAKAVKAKKVTLLDCNLTPKYKGMEIPGSIKYFNAGPWSPTGRGLAKKPEELEKLLPANKKALIVVYCGHPGSSLWKKGMKAAEALGYTNVKHFKPGVAGWTKMGKAAKPAGGDKVTISCSFTPYGGAHYKKSGANYVAVYIMDNKGTKILRTLLIIGKTWEMKYYRAKFKGGRVPPSRNAPDAVTRATRRDMKDVKVVWDLKDKDGKEMPPGTYRIYIELSEFDYTGALVYATIAIDGKSQTLTKVTEVDKPGSIHHVRVEYKAGAKKPDAKTGKTGKKGGK